MSLLLAHALEGPRIGFLVDETTGIRISLHPSIILGVVGLGAPAYSADAMVITSGRILGYIYLLETLEKKSIPVLTLTAQLPIVYKTYINMQVL
jgi:hypothetical protein